MKHIQLFFFLFASVALADEPLTNQDFFYVSPSVSNKYYAVYTLTAGTDKKDDPWRWAKPHLRVFDSANGKMSWEIIPPFVPKDSFYLTDLEGVWVHIPYWTWKEKAMDTPVVTIYQKDKILASYTLRQLGYRESALQNSVSHSGFAETSRPVSAWRSSIPATPEEGYAWSEFCNPMFKENTMIFRLNDGSSHTFDLQTGLLKNEKR